MLHQLTQNKFSQLTLTAGLCLTTVFANPIDRNATKTTETTFNQMARDEVFQNGTSFNGANLNGTSFNGTSFNGMSFNGANLNGANLNGVVLNGSGLGANGINFSRFKLTSSASTTALLKQKPIQQIRLEGGQLALKIKRSD